MKPALRFVVALSCEAEPLVFHYRLQALGGVFRTYGDGQVALVVSGLGKLAAAAATAYLHGLMDRDGAPRALWFNVGTGGHRDKPVGEAVLGTEITDVGSGRSWELRPPAVGLAVAPIATVDQPETAFDGDDVYDMEAAGFCSSALRFAPPELVQCFKVISDNRLSPKRRIPPREVEGLIRNRTMELAAAVEAAAGMHGPVR